MHQFCGLHRGCGDHSTQVGSSDRNEREQVEQKRKKTQESQPSWAGQGAAAAAWSRSLWGAMPERLTAAACREWQPAPCGRRHISGGTGPSPHTLGSPTALAGGRRGKRGRSAVQRWAVGGRQQPSTCAAPSRQPPLAGTLARSARLDAFAQGRHRKQAAVPGHEAAPAGSPARQAATSPAAYWPCTSSVWWTAAAPPPSARRPHTPSPCSSPASAAAAVAAAGQRVHRLAAVC